jgi:hypothetical protein
MSRAEQILNFYDQLRLKNSHLPKDVEAMNPYDNPSPEVEQVIKEFYSKYYGDNQRRGLILGINPGRMGAGITGIPFTDSYKLQEDCGISFPVNTRETSAQFVYEVIAAYGGPKLFYQHWFIGAVSPLGFIHKNKRGNWVNFNYYDTPELERAVRPFIIESLRKQRALCGQPEVAIVWGNGKNYSYLKALNKQEGFFKEVIPLEHPRYIMQYKLKLKEGFIKKYTDTLTQKLSSV